MNVELEQFGEERLMEVVGRLDGLTAAGARDAILDEVGRFLDGVRPQDDLTLVVLRVD
jgi:serine phosphatase RsbU (regulator of sigma subunit)